MSEMLRVREAVAAFPEVRPFCVQLLMIRSTDSSDMQNMAEAV